MAEKVDTPFFLLFPGCSDYGSSFRHTASTINNTHNTGMVWYGTTTTIPAGMVAQHHNGCCITPTIPEVAIFFPESTV
jgi:hypothetical protein